MNVTHATAVQVAALPQILSDRDVVIQAKLGVGKTLGVLMGVTELLYRAKRPENRVSAVLLTATREAALTIQTMAMQLATHTDIWVETVAEGGSVARDLPKFQRRVDLLIATPERLRAHAAATPGAAEKIAAARLLVLDDADRMLEDHLWPDVERLAGILRAPDRQTVACARTMSPVLQDKITRLMREGAVELQLSPDAALAGDAPPASHRAMVLSYLEQFPALMALLREEIQKPPFKVAVFFPTARMTEGMTHLFSAMGLQVLELHIRKSAAHRAFVLEQFRHGQNVILFSSDVPPVNELQACGVTCAIQVGMCNTPRQFATRVGLEGAAPPPRTVLLLADFERPFLEGVARRYPVAESPAPAIATGDRAILDRGIQKLAQQAKGEDAKRLATQVYVSWLGFYLGERPLTGLSKEQTVATANAFLAWLSGGRRPPAIMPSTVVRLKLEAVEGVVVDDKIFDV